MHVFWTLFERVRSRELLFVSGAVRSTAEMHKPKNRGADTLVRTDHSLLLALVPYLLSFYTSK